MTQFTLAFKTKTKLSKTLRINYKFKIIYDILSEKSLRTFEWDTLSSETAIEL